MEPKSIVAIEIASSKIKGGVASVTPDGRMTVLAIEEIPAVGNVRYGRVQNIREVSSLVNEIVRKLEMTPAVAPRTVRAAAVSLGGRSLSAVPAKSGLKFPAECEITENHIDRLKYEAVQKLNLDKAVVEVLPRMFYLNSSAVPKVAGTYGETVQGEFMVVSCARETWQNLERLKFDRIDPADVLFVTRQTAIADFVLTSEERELGCALVDFGAETSTVAVYKAGSLAFLSVIPMGSRLITLDLMSGLGLTEEAAENYKITLGTLADGGVNADNANAQEVNAYVRARAGEIAANILSQIERAEASLSDGAISRIVLVGGGARLPEFAALLHNQCKMPVRVAEMPAAVVFRTAGRNNAANIDIVALLAAAARRMPDSCLAEPPAEPEPVPFADETEETEEEPAVQPAPQTRRRDDSIYEPQRDRRRRVDEDDDRLMADDPDDDDAAPAGRSGRQFPFFGIGRRKKSAPEEEETDRSDFSDEEGIPYDDDEVDAPAGSRSSNNGDDTDDDRYRQTNNRISALRDRFVKFFSGADIEEEEDET